MRIILKLFVSLKSAVFLISILTLLSMIGTLVPQNLEAADYLRQFPKMGHWILALGFDDMYRSILFQLCLWCLSLSTLVCIMTRWQSTSKRLFNRLQNVSKAEVEAFPAAKYIETTLREDWQQYYPNFKTDEDGVQIGLRTSGKMSLFGGMCIHIGLLAVLAGGLIGVFWGVEMAIHGRRGEKVVIPPLEAIRAARDADRLSRTARNLRTFSPEDPRLNEWRQQVETLQAEYTRGMASPAFSIFFEDLWVDYYGAGAESPQGVKSWNSKVRFVENAVQSEPVVVMVNQPVTHREFTFYQASWSKYYRKIRMKIDLIENMPGWLDFKAPASFPQTLEVTVGEPIKPEWSPVTLVVQDFMPDFRVVGDRFVTVSHELNNPAARIVAFDQAGAVAGRAWAFPEDRIMLASHVSNLPFLFTFVEADPEFESGMQMTHDPGKPVVWLGCLLFTLGMIMSFYVTYREDWVLIYPNNRIKIAVGGNRPSVMLLADIKTVEAQLTATPQETPANE